MNVLSIQSRVVYGHVGNAAAGFVLERLGHEVWPIDTVTFSNHTGYQTFRGRVHGPEELAPLVEGLSLIGVLPRCDAVLSGYLGQAGNAAVVQEALEQGRAANCRALYLCDPVMGDRSSGLYVKPGIVETFATRLCPMADIMTPNAFEVELLTQGSTATLDDALAATDRLLARSLNRDAIVVVTSLTREDADPGSIETLARQGDTAWLVTTPRLEVPIYGSGDVFSALFLGFYMEKPDLPETLARAVSAIFAIFEASARDPGAELALSAAQDRLRQPPRFKPQRVR
ncbi:MAG: pyridoxal kinase PdxY [Rhodospirillaceae bacterium]|nr:pyridoxal kinase PdxY [Rhodospirillaceae bacterium]